MRYQQPFGVSDRNAGYIDGNPALGIEGSAVPAAAIEHPMRELVYLIRESGLDPDEKDLTQVWQAIGRMIAAAIAARLKDVGLPIGTGLLLPWEVDELATEAPGWYPGTGIRYPLDSHPGKALNGLSAKYKANWGVTVTDVGGVLHINTPNYYHTDGRGLFMRPGTLVGSVRPDTMRPITGTTYGTPAQSGNISGAITSTVISGGAGSGTALLLHQYRLDSARLGLSFSGTETVPIHALFTPAIYLGGPK